MAEHTLILLRHAKSDWSGDEADIDRPLAQRGRRQAPEAGQWLAIHLDRIDLAVVSPAKRARATWDLVSAELDQRPETRHADDAYAASVGELLDIIRGLGEVMYQMQLTVRGLAEVTKVVSGFAFSFGADGPTESDLARFNDYLLAPP